MLVDIFSEPFGQAPKIEPVVPKRLDVYSEPFWDYRGKIVVVVVPQKGTAKSYRRRSDETYRNQTLRELDQLLVDFCGMESH